MVITTHIPYKTIVCLTKIHHVTVRIVKTTHEDNYPFEWMIKLNKKWHYAPTSYRSIHSAITEAKHMIKNMPKWDDKESNAVAIHRITHNCLRNSKMSALLTALYSNNELSFETSKFLEEYETSIKNSKLLFELVD